MSNRPRIRLLGEEDLAFADGLRATVGWNQTLPDWRRFRAAEPEGCFLAELEGRPVGTATTLRHGAQRELAWVGMVLVDPAHRRRGIGRALLKHALAWLEDQGVRWVRLDATPAGKLVYDGLGFREDWTLSRWERTSGSTPPERGSSPFEAGVVAAGIPSEAHALDRTAFGVDRSRLLEALRLDSLAVVRCTDPSDGFGMIRAGSRAGYLGPVIARDPVHGRRLIAALLAEYGTGPVFWDLPDANLAAVAYARELGFVQQRVLHRMTLHLSRERPSIPCPEDRPWLQWGLAGPEVG